MTGRSLVQSLVDAITSVAVVTASLAIVWSVAASNGRPGPTVATPSASPPARVIKVSGMETSLSTTAKRTKGAKLAIIEFSDFECPFCGRYARDVYPRIQEEWVDKGVVAYSFRHFPLESLHPSAFMAGEASECAGRQNKFWEMHDVLFANQKKMQEQYLLGFARRLGLDESQFAGCLNGQATAVVREDQMEAKRFGISGTPSFLIGVIQAGDKVKVLRQMSGAQPFEAFQAAVQEVLGEI